MQKDHYVEVEMCENFAGALEMGKSSFTFARSVRNWETSMLFNLNAAFYVVKPFQIK